MDMGYLQEFTFGFDELSVDQKQIGFLLGYGDGPLPDPFGHYLEMVLSDARNLPDIKGAFCVPDDIRIDLKNFCLLAGRHQFDVGKILCNELKGSERIAFYVCTAGKTISDKGTGLLHGEDPVLGYIYDTLGSIIAEAACDVMQSSLKKEVENCNDRITNRYSPGYCHWPVSDQHKLFSFFPEGICGISLTGSALMSPIKSVSGIIGIGKNVKFRNDAACMLCSMKDCIYRNAKFGMKTAFTKVAPSGMFL